MRLECEHAQCDGVGLVAHLAQRHVQARQQVGRASQHLPAYMAYFKILLYRFAGQAYDHDLEKGICWMQSSGHNIDFLDMTLRNAPTWILS